MHTIATVGRTALLATLLLTLAGCGFHLRGGAVVPAELQPIYIGGDAAFGLLGQRLRIRLLDDSVNVTRDPTAANVQLIVLSQGVDERMASIDQRGRIAESALIAAATFELRDREGRLVWGPINVAERRTIINNPDNISATNEEKRLTQDEMIDSLAARILRRAGAYRPDTEAR